MRHTACCHIFAIIFGPWLLGFGRICYIYIAFKIYVEFDKENNIKH